MLIAAESFNPTTDLGRYLHSKFEELSYITCFIRHYSKIYGIGVELREVKRPHWGLCGGPSVYFTLLIDTLLLIVILGIVNVDLEAEFYQS